MKLWPILIVVLLLSLKGCSEAPDETQKTIMVGVLPDQEISVLKQRYQPLLQYLHQSTGLNYRLILPKSYAHLLELFGQKQLDLALFGGVTYVKAADNFQATPLVMRNIDDDFSSVIIANKRTQAQTLQQLKGLHFAFGSKLSTSGHYMPRYFLSLEQIDPWRHFGSISYSNGHDTTALWVQNGKVDAGAVNRQIVQQMLENGRLNKSDIAMIWQSPTYADYVWAVQPTMDKQRQMTIRDAFLSLDKQPIEQQVLSNLQAKYFIPASDSDFDNLRKAINQFDEPEPH